MLDIPILKITKWLKPPRLFSIRFGCKREKQSSNNNTNEIVFTV